MNTHTHTHLLLYGLTEQRLHEHHVVRLDDVEPVGAPDGSHQSE
jgi:hypothetical protein